MPPAAARVFAIPELLEHILFCLAESSIDGVDAFEDCTAALCSDKHDLHETSVDGSEACNEEGDGERAENNGEDGNDSEEDDDEDNNEDGDEAGDDSSIEDGLEEFDPSVPDHNLYGFYSACPDFCPPRNPWKHGDYPQPFKSLTAVQRVNSLFHNTIKRSKKIQMVLQPPSFNKVRNRNPSAIKWLVESKMGLDLERLWISGKIFGLDVGLIDTTDSASRNRFRKIKDEDASWKTFELCAPKMTVFYLGAVGLHDSNDPKGPRDTIPLDECLPVYDCALEPSADSLIGYSKSWNALRKFTSGLRALPPGSPVSMRRTR